MSAVAKESVLALLWRRWRDPAAWATTADIFVILIAVSLPWSTPLVAIFAAASIISTDQVMEGFVRSGKLALNCWVAPSIRVTDAGETELVLATVIVTLPLFVGSATLVAVIVWEPSWAGALYRPVISIGPVVESPPATMSTDQVTAVLVVPVTVAVNCRAVPSATFVEDC